MTVNEPMTVLPFFAYSGMLTGAGLAVIAAMYLAAWAGDDTSAPVALLRAPLRT